MDQQSSSRSSLPKIRTFAEDLKRVNPNANNVPAKAEDIPTQEKDIPKAKGATSLPKIKPIPTPKPPVPIVAKKTEMPPAFHTLQKKTIIAKSPAPIPKKTSDNIEITGSNDDYASSTIIRDTVRRRTNVFSAIGTSLINLKNDIKRFWKRANQPLYVVPETERRKGVIQQATSQTGKSFTGDYERLKERLRQRAEQDDTVPEHDISWSPNTEPGFQLLPGASSAPEISNVTIEPRKTFQSTQTATASLLPTAQMVDKKPIIPKIKPVLAPKTTAIPPPVVVEPTKKEPGLTAPSIAPVPEAINTTATTTVEYKPAIPSAPPAAMITPDVVATRTVQPSIQSYTVEEDDRNDAQTTDMVLAGLAGEETMPTPTPPRVPVTRGAKLDTRSQNKSITFFNQLTTNTLTIIIASFLLVLATLVFVTQQGIRILLNNQAGTGLERPVQVVGLTIHPTHAVPYTIMSDLTMTAALQSAGVAQGTAELYLTQPTGQVWSVSQILAAHNMSVAPAFGASLSQLRWIAIDGTVIGILFTYTNPTQVKGSLLAWEASLGREIPNLLATVTASNSTFIDKRIGGADVRMNEVGLTYGFATDGHGIIAISEAAYLAIRESINQ